MNILIINGSPRKKGLISQMLSIMQEEAETRGDTVEMVYTNDLTVKPCAGCMACRAKEKCVLAEDDSQRVLKMMQQADAIIMGAPCYWGNIPGQMKLMFDRQVYGMMRDTNRFPEPLMKGKKCILISTCTIERGGTAMHPELTEKDKQKCRKAINKLYIIKNKNSNDY